MGSILEVVSAAKELNVIKYAKIGTTKLVTRHKKEVDFIRILKIRE